QRPIFRDKTSKCHHRLRTALAVVNRFKDRCQLLPGGLLRAKLLHRSQVDSAALPLCLPGLVDEVLSVEALPPRRIAILTQPDTAGLDSFSDQFEMPLFFGWGTSVG